MPTTREEFDALGAVQVDAQRLWGAQTQRALVHFDISTERMPVALIHALASVKRACAQVNGDLGLLPAQKVRAIVAAAEEVMAGRHEAEFPLSVWQTGSGTQTHMNMNEVLANRASEYLGGPRGQGRLVHPHDEVNLGQSSNDVFPTAMHLAAALGLSTQLLPALDRLHASLQERSQAFAAYLKLGRTHLQDATPITLGQEFSGYVAQLAQARLRLQTAMDGLYPLAIGGTAVGTGLNTHPQFGQRVAAELARVYAMPFESADNKFAALAAHDALVAVHGQLKTLAVALTKIANDIRWLASGPRSGLGEIRLPDNEPGSSIMPGKVNPTQCEALTMLCAQVMGNDVAIGIGAASGHFELNVYKPLLAHNLLQSIRLLGDGMGSFERYCVRGVEAQPLKMREHLQRSLMLVTALVPHIGHDRAAQVARLALDNNTSLTEAALSLGCATQAQLDRWLDPSAMLGPQATQ
ncbi:class II fumarate hydratase [Limnohabitans radicicola]|uniref:Fumarate hydratase class II n=1 Tax=Limnohabitans radicicola TaxID=2771427 RepID=A0A927FGC3_9BURK|nr:class II fumarate hydratase [Limnohabitans radicicola]MBD8050925.1 class II fumarate hydratase [Limnohabitans radicicola]